MDCVLLCAETGDNDQERGIYALLPVARFVC